MRTGWKAAAILSPAAILAAVAVAYGAVTPHEDGSKTDSETTPSVEERFADAPHGVDPFVSGPVSENFRQRQKAFDCDEASWPDIPAACYPEMKTKN